ncbi:MAG: LysR family transcriptional regulator [Gammaproteobacteria bacterium]|nr:LysR family transcriptional regulator [Gammaproteobacteria bacterium]MCW8986702.1 LysR family transcriptional regulator [Gammaproteobacteria bacterium]
MNITFRQLEVFEVVARLLSYTRASKELHLSQPAVSMQIKQLEENAGLPLFEQIGRKIYLTEAGREMYHYSRAIAEQLDEVDDVFEQLKGVKSGRLEITVATTANAFATRMLSMFSKQFEGSTVSLDVTNRERLLRQIADNEKDIAIMGRPPADAELEIEPFADNPLVVVAAPDHPLVAKQPIPLYMLQDQTFVVREQGSGTRTAMERFFDEHNLSITSSMEMNENEAIKQAVQAGMGLGIVSIHTIELELETNRLVILDVEDFPIMRHWYLVHRKEKRLSPITQAFKDFVLSEGRNLISNIST